MKRSTRMLLMNSGKNSQNPDRRLQEARGDSEGRYTPGREYGGMSYPASRTGFSLSGEIGRVPEDLERKYKSMGDRTGGMEYHHAAPQSMEHRKGEGEDYTPLSRSMAVEWTRDMENSDGTHGPHWNMEQVKQVMEQREIDCDPVMFFAVLNAVYSDYYAVAKKHGVNKMDFYADLAKAWLEDEDAVEDKAGKYFQYIVKH